MFELNGKVCLITGGSRGLGESMAITFAKSGAEAVVITYNSDENKAIEVCKNIEIHGSKSMAIHLEVSNTDSIKKMVSSVEKEFSKIDVLVNNAGINRQAKMEDVTEKDWDAIMAVNLKGPFFCSTSTILQPAPFLASKRQSSSSYYCLSGCDNVSLERSSRNWNNCSGIYWSHHRNYMDQTINDIYFVYAVLLAALGTYLISAVPFILNPRKEKSSKKEKDN